MIQEFFLKKENLNEAEYGILELIKNIELYDILKIMN